METLTFYPMTSTVIRKEPKVNLKPSSTDSSSFCKWLLFALWADKFCWSV